VERCRRVLGSQGLKERFMPQIGLLFLLLLPLAAAPIRVQITTGGHPHDISFYSLFENQKDLEITVNPHPSAYARNLRKFADVLVLYDLDDVTSEKEQQNLRNFLESGGGLVILHHALADNWQWKWWYEEVVGGRFLMGPDGDMPPSTAKAPVILNVRPVAATHPVLDGVSELKLDDEAYKGEWISPRAMVLMETDNPENMKQVVWIGPWQKSRVVVIQVGHGPGAHQDPGFRRLVRNALVWAAGR
jgi:type 1 glutamine amidotransferase